MKQYRLIVSSEVFDALDKHLDYIAVTKQDPATAERWFRKAWARLQTLKTLPNRCPTAPEDPRFDFKVRMLIVDKCLFTYRVDEANRVVRVLGFRHAAQQHER